MNMFRNDDVVLLAGRVVAIDGDRMRVEIGGTEVLVPCADVSLLTRAFHENDPVTVDNGAKARIVTTLEKGVHLIQYDGRVGTAAYQVVGESMLDHRDEDPLAEAPEADAPVTEAPAAEAQEVEAPVPEAPVEAPEAEAPVEAEQAVQAAPAVNEPEAQAADSQPETAPRPVEPIAPLAILDFDPDVDAERTDTRTPADTLAGALDGNTDGLQQFDIDLEALGASHDYRPVGDGNA